MKKLILTMGLVTASLICGFSQVKEGSINYSIDFEGLPEQQAAMMKGMEMKQYYKNGKVRMENIMAFGTTTTIVDEKGNTTILSDMMGAKKYATVSAADAEKKDKKKKKTEDPKITYSNEKKTIANYECKKALIETKSDEGEVMKSEVWYCEELQFPQVGSGEKQFKGLKGAPLEFSMNVSNGIKMIMKASQVSTSPVSNSKFEVNTTGYDKMSEEEMKQMSGGR